MKMSITEFRQRLAQASEAYDQSGDLADALRSGFGDTATHPTLSAAERAAIEQKLEEQARQEIPCPYRGRFR
jgi:hypothetical protein